jgi:hypothetical protein
MTEYYMVLEIADDAGKPTGTYRYTRRTDDPVTGPYGLCEHAHATREEAENCPVAKEIVDCAFGRDPESKQSRVDRLKQKLAEAEADLASGS